MKRLSRKVLFFGVLMLLASCAQANKTEQSTDKVQKSGVTSTQTQQADEYRMLFIDGKYRASATRGYALELGTVENIASFETGLMQLSKKEFSPSDYYFIEGQFITTKEIDSWLGEKTAENPNGINTKQDNKRFISTILEQDYMILNNGNFELSGVSIGLALNPKLSDSQSLTDEELLAKGKEAASALLAQLRAKEGFSTIPIMIGLFKQSVDNGVSHGVYLATATSTSGNTFKSWKDTKFEKRVFPLENDKKEDATVFTAFKRNIEKFFPNLNGVVGNATFVDGKMTNLDIRITTQFYGQAEMIAFEQFLMEQAKATYTNAELAVKIRVETVRGTELVVFKKAGETTYQSTVLN